MEWVALSGLGVLSAGLAALAWCRRLPLAKRCDDGAQEITISICGCFAPDRFRARRGVPLRIHFERDDDAGHADRVYFPDFKIERFTPRGRTTTVALMPERRGEYMFASSEGIYSGAFKV